MHDESDDTIMNESVTQPQVDSSISRSRDEDQGERRCKRIRLTRKTKDSCQHHRRTSSRASDHYMPNEVTNYGNALADDIAMHGVEGERRSRMRGPEEPPLEKQDYPCNRIGCQNVYQHSEHLLDRRLEHLRHGVVPNGSDSSCTGIL